MSRYYVNRNTDAKGDHEVHKEGCSWMPMESNRTYLGQHASCYSAVRKARIYYDTANGCYYCSSFCHTS